MKTNIFKKIGAICLVAGMMASCSDILDEQPRSQFDPTFFSTETGIEGGLTALYAHLRYIYGNGYYLNICETGTDEYTWGESADGNFKDADLSGEGKLNASTSRSDVLWGQAFSNINTASGVIENGEAGGMSPSLIAEAYFFRAFDYFQLVQTFGGVPLDLGAGEMKFNTSPVRTSVRNTVPEVYTRAIFPDLLKAVNDLPETPRLTGAASKALARLFLAKAYLTYGWWLENPKGIPTYPEASRTDPDGHDANWYYAQAYQVAVDAINYPGPYALQPTFYDVNVATNDRNSEIMLYADHDENEKYGNGGVGYGWGSGGSPENFAYWMTSWNYGHIVAQKGSDASANINPVQREAVQALGRPWTRMAAIADNFLSTGVWADKVNDSRYDATFTLRYHTNFDKAGSGETTVIGANGMAVKAGEPIFSFVDEETAKDITWSSAGNGYADIGAGVLPGRADYVVGVNNISRYKYPINWKIGMYRTDNNGTLGTPNGGSPRPFVIAKFSELYLIAAEAAVKLGHNDDARSMINVLRARAGKWRWCQNDNVAKVEDHSAEMVAATPATITIDYVLDERKRELWGEGYRWFDLVRTQTWQEKAGTFHIAGKGRNDHDLQTFTRTITKDHYLRPIPQGQIDGLEMSDDEKELYQNPAYRD